MNMKYIFRTQIKKILLRLRFSYIIVFHISQDLDTNRFSVASNIHDFPRGLLV